MINIIPQCMWLQCCNDLHMTHDVLLYTCIVPGTPNILDAQNQSITITWQPPNVGERCNPPILYSVRVEGRQQPLCIGQQQMESNTIDTYAVITGLCPYTLYRISVKACTDVCGEYSNPVSVQTLEDGM